MTLVEQNISQQVGRQIAVIVAGDPSLNQIMAKKNLTAKFIEVIDKCNVVLACRVSPK